jgi:phage terminase small subunit
VFVSKLTPKQQAFVDEYLIDLNATQAAIRAGYSKKTAQVIGAENLVKPMVKEEIQKRLLAAQARRAETLDDILNELDENRKAALGAETVQASAATAATMAKAKLLGFVTDKTELTGKDGGAIKTESTVTMTPEDAYKAAIGKQ